jgi:glucose/arabinose dehydrogenase
VDSACGEKMPKRSMPTVVSLLWWFVTLFTTLFVILGAMATAQSLRGKEAFSDWQHDKPGTIRLIKPADLPEPGATSSAAKVSRVVPRPPAAAPQVPPGFKVELFAEGLNGPRIIRVAPNGDILVGVTRAGRIRILRNADGAARPVANEVFADGLDSPFGIAFFPPSDEPALDVCRQ